MSHIFDSRTITLTGALAFGCAVFPLGSIAEEGVRARLDVSNRLETVNESGFDRPQREGERFVTGLNFGLTSENNSQFLGFFADTDIAYNTNDNVVDQLEIEDPALRLAYRLQSRESLLNFDARYRRTDVDNANFIEDADTSDVETGEGERTNITVRTGLVLGREAPITFSINHLYATNTFSGDNDGNPSDSTTNRVDTTLLFRLSQVASVGLVADWRDIDRDDPDSSDQTEKSIGIRTVYDLSRVLTFEGQITYDEATSTNTDREDTSGLGFNFGLDRQLTNGLVGFDVSSTETINGARQQALVRRTMLIPRGRLSYSIGATKTDGSSLNPLVNLGLNYDTSDTGRFNINLRQSSAVDGDNDETIRTRLNLRYTETINSISSISVSADFANQDVLDDESVDRSSIAARLTYRRAVGGDWDMVTGYEYSSSRRDGEENRNRSTLFVGLEKSFDWRP